MQEHRTRDVTRDLIVRVLRQSHRPMTRTELARALNRKKTPHLIDMIEDLVAEGVLLRDTTTFHNGVSGYVYHVAPEADNGT